ncbi:plasmid replication initiator TrfA [Paraburkholderia strydomiana]|uniref:plasmid replication initiator TrfA n=1 Tax=Paraburkholderia strydomiana TaxID=1245417 RepID=UPI0038BA8D63
MKDELSRHYRIELNRELIRLFGESQWMALDWKQRQQLRRKAVAQALHAFYSSHRQPFPVKLDTLRGYVGSRNFEKARFKVRLRAALDGLVKTGLLVSYSIDDVVSVERAAPAIEWRSIPRPPVPTCAAPTGLWTAAARSAVAHRLLATICLRPDARCRACQNARETDKTSGATGALHLRGTKELLFYGRRMTAEQAQKTIKRCSLFPGEPNWTIAPNDGNLRAVLRAVHARLESESRARLAEAPPACRAATEDAGDAATVSVVLEQALYLRRLDLDLPNGFGLVGELKRLSAHLIVDLCG